MNTACTTGPGTTHTPGLGVGMDMPWSAPYGIIEGEISPRTIAFLEREGHRFSSAFVSWQPRDRGVPTIDAVEAPFEAFFARVPHAQRCLHQTAFNLAGVGYDRAPLIRFTNALIERFNFAWVNEDLGLWSVRGWSLPYPQAPLLSQAAIHHCAATCRDVDAQLVAPLVVEFPGFETHPGGEIDAYDAFRQVIERSGCACNLDTGHLLTWRWLQGYRGDALLDGLERLPLEHCIELHCAGVIQTGDRLIDAHHGVLTELQFALVERLQRLCPNLRLITYEDPRFDEQGVLPPPAAVSLDRLQAQVEAWTPAPARPLPVATAADTPSETAPWEDALIEHYLSPDGARLRQPLLSRSTRGLPRPDAIYDLDDQVLVDFLSSAEGQAWSDMAWAVPGRALEDALGRFLDPGSSAHLTACAKLLAVHPDPPFDVPEGFSRSGYGWFAIGVGPVLYATANGRVIIGAINPLIERILHGERPAGSAPAVARLVALGLLADRPVLGR